MEWVESHDDGNEIWDLSQWLHRNKTKEVEIAVVRGPCVLAWQKKTTYTIPLVSCASTTTAWDNARRAGKDVEQEDSTCYRSCFM